jgi:hypothetical protein
LTKIRLRPCLSLLAETRLTTNPLNGEAVWLGWAVVGYTLLLCAVYESRKVFAVCGMLRSPLHAAAKPNLAGTVYGHAFALLHPALGALLGLAYILSLAGRDGGATYKRLAGRPVPDFTAFLEILAVVRSLR